MQKIRPIRLQTQMDNANRLKVGYDEWSRQDLIDEIKKLRRRKKYGIVWDEENTKEKFGKDAEHKLPVFKEVEDKQVITDKNKPVNVLIEGDNYFALSVLNYTHRGKGSVNSYVKCMMLVLCKV